MNSTTAREWHLFLGALDSDSAIGEMTRLAQRTDDAYDITNYVLHVLAGCPDGDIEESLRVARTTLVEACTALQEVASVLRRYDPDAA